MSEHENPGPGSGPKGDSEAAEAGRGEARGAGSGPGPGSGAGGWSRNWDPAFFPGGEASRTFWSRAGESLGLLVVLMALALVFGALSPNFLSGRSLATIANNIPDLAIVAVGMTLVILVGGIDLSVGSTLALSGAALGTLVVDGGFPAWVGALAALTAGTVCGLANGWITTTWRVPAFIVTLGTLEMARGGAYLLTDSQTRALGPDLEFLVSPGALGVGIAPSFLIALGVAVPAHLALTRMVIGRHLVAVGTNERAARLSGIDSKPLKTLVFAFCGFTAGLAGVLQCARLQTADPNGGVGLELSAIAAVVIGGASLGGGRASVPNTVLGALVIGVLEAGLAQAGASDAVKRLITGGVIVGAVVFDGLRTRWREARLERRRAAIEAMLGGPEE